MHCASLTPTLRHCPCSPSTSAREVTVPSSLLARKVAPFSRDSDCWCLPGAAAGGTLAARSRRVHLHATPSTASPSARPKRSSVSNSLLDVLKDELKLSQEMYRHDSQVDEIPSEFLLQESDGTASLYLVRQHSEEETIAVRVMLDQQGEAGSGDEDDEDEEEAEDEESLPAPDITFQVFVVKGGRCLSFTAQSNGDYTALTGLSLEEVADDDDTDQQEGLGGFFSGLASQGGDGEERPAGQAGIYPGPPFDSLDTTLQQAFVDYLEERGVNGDLCKWLVGKVVQKKALEYQSWLERVKDFVAA